MQRAEILELFGAPARNTGEQEMTWSEKIRDREAFTALYRMHEPAIFRFSLSMTGDRAIAAEVTQDVFVWLIHHPENFDPARGELGSFLLGVTRKFLLRRGREERRLTTLDEGWHVAAEQADEDAAADVETLRTAIGALPPRYREVVVLCDLEGRSYEEAATALGCATGTVRSRLHRARQFLERKMKLHGSGRRCAV
ncbi:MAG TPA: RNA polymerase sigma factor [Bryobacteraceae bacterium]|jgi:RNA polymerase sigma-70 factor (ECF subfamily)|nr:RNA polymerase sigma factor [Bryobacteraceae bacterium]